MKPCSKNRERIALLAMEDLEAGRERELRDHIDSCPGCRGYLEEISSIAGKLRAAEPESRDPAAAAFHRNVVAALAAAERRSPMQRLPAQVGCVCKWRLALPAAAAALAIAVWFHFSMLVKRVKGTWAAAALAIAVWFHAAPRPGAPPPAQSIVQAGVAADLQADLAPTFANYEMAARQSWEKLDALLTKQGQRNPAPMSNYSAASLAMLDAPD